MVGRLITTKHQDKLIELFLNLDIPEWRLVLVGYDHLKQTNFDRLQAIIDRNNGQKQVMLVGRQVDVDSFYKRSKIFAFTSSSEGFPNAIGEAMSAGLPAVAFDCIAGPSEMITDNHNGFLIPLFDYEQFREKLERLMKKEDLRASFGKNAREAVKLFSIPSIGEKYLQFILSDNRK
jgi:glycosyltransferase involved in cell wall biosynthesis